MHLCSSRIQSPLSLSHVQMNCLNDITNVDCTRQLTPQKNSKQSKNDCHQTSMNNLLEVPVLYSSEKFKEPSTSRNPERPHVANTNFEVDDQGHIETRTTFKDTLNDVAITFSMSDEYFDNDNSSYQCEHCGAQFWYKERLRGYGKNIQPKYPLCCRSGKVALPSLLPPPQHLQDLFLGATTKSHHFKKNIRAYNNMFCFTSMGGKIDHAMNNGGGPPTYSLNGQNYHKIGTLLPPEDQNPRFAQLYIYDTSNEINNRIRSNRIKIDDKRNFHDIIVKELQAILDEFNILVISFRMAREKLSQAEGARQSWWIY
ncbi:unnamed protein product [Cuscuta campestris]|uniref:Helitron helicase-like domain-containing protein n=1 Tax=Cuscuta campestris TaxID=132261 RepID=A0A484NI32_9ASTE|nr:unnamed protein product [Cuscuta campestris]